MNAPAIPSEAAALNARMALLLTTPASVSTLATGSFPVPPSPMSANGDGARLIIPSLTAAEAAQLDALAPTLGTWLANPELLKPPEPLIPRLAWRERITLYSALDKAGKSTLAAAGIAAASCGDAFLGEGGGAPVRVLAVCLEEHQGDLANRLKKFGADFTNVRIMAFPRNVRAEVKELVRLWRPDVVVIDTLVRYSQHDVTKSGDSSQWAAVMQDFIEMARRDKVAVLILHHATKKTGEARDSTDIPAACDIILEQKKRHSGGKQHVEVRSRLDLRHFTVKFDGMRYQLLSEAKDTADDAEPLCLTCLEAIAAQPMRHKDWKEASGETRATFNRHREALLNDECVRLDGSLYHVTEKGKGLRSHKVSFRSHETNSASEGFGLTSLIPHEMGVSETKPEPARKRRPTTPRKAHR